MKDMFKNKIATGFVVLSTVILAGVAIFTAYRLYQLRTRPVAPTAPESRPSAGEIQPESQEPISCEALTFNLTEEPSITPTGSLTPTVTPTVTVTPTLTPTVSPTLTVTPTTSPTPTDTPLGGTSPTPTTSPTVTPTTAEIAQVSPTPDTGTTLPDAGMGLPAIIGIFTGILLMIAALVLAL
jgi:hypothetical protein